MYLYRVTNQGSDPPTDVHVWAENPIDAFQLALPQIVEPKDRYLRIHVVPVARRDEIIERERVS